MKLLAPVVVALAILGLAPSARADDPSLHEVYQAIHAGHLSDAQTMMTKVLKDHPDSAKAHYMEAEVLVRMDRADEAQIELDHADRLAPGLPFASAEAQRSLRGLIAERSRARSSRSTGTLEHVADAPAAGAGFPWGPVLIIAGLGLAFYLFLRARRQALLGPGVTRLGMGPAGAPYGAAPYGAGPYGGAPYGGAPMGGGLGSGIVGGLATGAALGAGMVAGEALAHEFIGNHDRDRFGGDGTLADNGGAIADDGGGRDFGIADSGSWDSGSTDIGDSGGGGGGDWG